MTTPKIDHGEAGRHAQLIHKEWFVRNPEEINLARSYRDLAERHRRLVEAAKEYEAFRGQSEPNPAMAALGDRLRAALAEEEKEGSDENGD